MLTLYFSPGACSLASHIGLEETGAPYEAKPILLAKGQQRTEAYQKINPRGKVPALSVDGKILVENTAILTYLARRFPEKKLMPADPAEEARGIATMCAKGMRFEMLGLHDLDHAARPGGRRIWRASSG